MAALCGRSGLWKCGFQASLVVNKMHLSNSLMFPTRRYSCLAGKIQAITRNPPQVPNNSILQALKYVARQTRLVHSQRCLAVPILCRRPTLTTQSAIMFASLRNKLWPKLELQSPSGLNGTRFLATVNQYRWKKVRTKADMPKKIIPKSKRILLGPQRKGVCIKVFVRKPKKPNSGNRKCALLKLSNGRVITAYIPGERAVLQEHGVVLFEGGRVQDCPGVKYKIIRKKYDMN